LRLQKIFLVLALLLTMLVAGQMLKTLSSAVLQLRDGEKGLSAIRDLRLVLIAAEMASRERGPSNGVLGDDLPHDPDKLKLLSSARQKTDAAFSELIAAIEKEASRDSGLPEILLHAQQQLQLGRQSIDAIANVPRNQRAPEKIRDAIIQMFRVIDDLAPTALQLTNVAQTTYPDQTNFLLAARTAADLREFAGRLGSHFTVALTKREKIEMSELTSIEKLMGRIDQLHSSLLERVQAHPGDMAVQQATALVQNRYFESAIPYVREQLAIGLGNADFTTDAAGFAKRYVPDMDSIISLRNTLIDEALQNALLAQAGSKTSAYLIIFWTFASVVLLVTILWILEFRISRPLRKVIHLILEVAHGRLDISIPTLKYHDEMSEVLQAIAVLRDNSQARVVLEGERQELLVKLKEQAANDFLTELPNRRGFFDLVEPLFRALSRQGHPMSIAIFDIDYFKQVNDMHGHGMGDLVLKEIAQLSKSHLRSGDVVARFGGEEFLLFMPYCSLEEAFVKVEQLRKIIEAWTSDLPDGQALKITASFGVAQCQAADQSIQDLIARCDEKLYLAKAGGRNKVIF
jgi:diguanylate cyclase (GGDEF)-like protein